MTQDQRAHLRERLQTERERAAADLSRAEGDERVPPDISSGDVGRYHHHPADEASDTQEQEKDAIVARMESDVLENIAEALLLIDEDPERYETCRRCGRTIAFERLDIVPWTRLCAPCAKEEHNVLD